MNDDNDREKELLKSELEQLKRERESEKKGTWIAWVVVIWALPLFGMLLVQDGTPPPSGGISMFGIWFLGVPLVAFLIRKIGQ